MAIKMPPTDIAILPLLFCFVSAMIYMYGLYEYWNASARCAAHLSLDRGRPVSFVYLSLALCHVACTVYQVILHVSYSFVSQIKESKSEEENTRGEDRGATFRFIIISRPIITCDI